MTENWLQKISPCVRPVPQTDPRRLYTGRRLHSRRWIEPLRVIYDHELVLFTKGRFRVEISGKEYDCPALSFMIIPPGVWHITWNVGGGTGERRWCHFDWMYHGPVTDTPGMTYHPAKPKSPLYRPAPSFIPRTILRGPIQLLEQACDLHDRLQQLQALGGRHDRLASRALLLELLIHLLDSEENPPALKNRHSWLASRVRERLKSAVENRGDIPPIQSMLSELRYSYAHLCRLFHAEYGISPLKFVHALRIDRAKLLLRDTTLNVSEIAGKLGFRDVSYFCHLFRKMTGHAPLTYQNKIALTRQQIEGRGRSLF